MTRARSPIRPPPCGAQVEADARERKLREKELMVAHLHQRAEDRQDTEMRRYEDRPAFLFNHGT